MKRSLRSDTNLTKTTKAKQSSPEQFRVVFLASRQAVYQCLVEAALRHFSSLEFVHLDHLPAAIDEDVGLVLLGGTQEWGETDRIAECRMRFPCASIGLMVEAGAEAVDGMLIQERLIQGVIPMSLPLDVWFAVVSLLASGGEYLLAVPACTTPLKNVHTPQAPEETRMDPDRLGTTQALARRNGQLTQSVEASHQIGQEIDGIVTLTTREREILEFVSKGFQNKTIADRMTLSEHTVKAHVHNLIAKLRVSNRTQAAAFLHERQARGIPGRGRPSTNSFTLRGGD